MRKKILKGLAVLSPERRREIARMGGLAFWSSLTPEEHSKRARLRTTAYMATLTPEQRSERARYAANARYQKKTA